MSISLLRERLFVNNIIIGFVTGGDFIATTYIKLHKQTAKRTVIQSLKDRFDYGLNPEERAVSSYLYDPETAHAEFVLVKGQYQAETDRTAGAGSAVPPTPPSLSPKGKSPQRRPTGSAMRRRCAGQRENINFLSAPILTRATFTITFTTIPRPMTAPGNSATSSAPALPCGGCLTGYAWNTRCPW